MGVSVLWLFKKQMLISDGWDYGYVIMTITTIFHYAAGARYYINFIRQILFFKHDYKIDTAYISYSRNLKNSKSDINNSNIIISSPLKSTYYGLSPINYFKACFSLYFFTLTFMLFNLFIILFSGDVLVITALFILLLSFLVLWYLISISINTNNNHPLLHKFLIVFTLLIFTFSLIIILDFLLHFYINLVKKVYFRLKDYIIKMNNYDNNNNNANSNSNNGGGNAPNNKGNGERVFKTSEAKRKKKNEYNKKQRAAMSPEELEALNFKNNERKKMRKAEMSPEDREAVRVKDCEYEKKRGEDKKHVENRNSKRRERYANNPEVRENHKNRAAKRNAKIKAEKKKAQKL